MIEGAESRKIKVIYCWQHWPPHKDDNSSRCNGY